MAVGSSLIVNRDQENIKTEIKSDLRCCLDVIAVELLAFDKFTFNLLYKNCSVLRNFFCSININA